MTDPGPDQPAHSELSTNGAIRRFRFGNLFAGVVNAGLLATALTLTLVWSGGGHVGYGLVGLGCGGVWMLLGVRSIRRTRSALQAGPLVAAGEAEEAQTLIAHALDTFSILRSPRVLAMHQLARLRHRQKRWPEAMELCRVQLSAGLRGTPSLAHAARLIHADAALEIGDLHAAHESITHLEGTELPVAEAMRLQLLRLEYQARMHAWDAMLWNVREKVESAESLPTETAARTQALLALAASNRGNVQLASWLVRRVELLVDVHDLVKDRPLLEPLSGLLGRETEKAGGMVP